MSGAAAAAPVPALRVVLTVLVPFGLGYYLSYLFRIVNAVISEPLVAEIGLSPADLGLMTSVYFIAFAAFQIPLGLLLDRYGPARVQAVLLVFAASGAALFAVGQSFWVLSLARGLIGLGVSACLMAALKANAEWWPADRLALVNNVTAAFGGFGALSATAPVHALLEVAGWRDLFMGLAALTLLVSLLTWTAVPARRGRAVETGSWRAAAAAFPAIASSAYFWRMAVVLGVCHGAFLVYQSLWAAPWLRDVAGLDPDGVAEVLFLIQLGMFAGILSIGVAADWLQRLGISIERVIAVGIAVFIALQAALAAGTIWRVGLLWFAVGFAATTPYLGFALLTRHFPDRQTGRVVTSANLVVFLLAFVFQWGVGAVIGAFAPTGGGGYPREAHAAAFWIMVGLQAAAWAWFVRPPRGRA